MPIDIKYLEDEIIDQYLYDENTTRPWIIGFSGGKDSTMLLQLVWNAINNLPAELRTRKIYVVCNDTLVENPRIVKFIEKTLDKVQAQATRQAIPMQVQQTLPKFDDSFWVKVIGLGYPAPNKVHRWCTDRLKIDPTTRFITEKIKEEGGVIILLGTRAAESNKRAANIQKYGIKGQRLRKHQLPETYVYAPIKDITTTEVWQYLNQVPPPWGGSHKELVTLYRNANAGDCPLVIDNTTQSCGQSRFGCWVCTVVNKDKSMEGLIENGEDWMQPLSDIRNFLVESRDKPEIYRDRKRRNGTEKENMWGPYTFETRVDILTKVLKAQKEIQESEGIELISHQEMVLIQYHWFRDTFFKVKVSEIYNSIFKTDMDMSRHEEKFKKEADLLRQSCKKEPKDFDLIQDLLMLQKTKTLMIRKKGLHNDIENRLERFIKDGKK